MAGIAAEAKGRDLFIVDNRVSSWAGAGQLSTGLDDR